MQLMIDILQETPSALRLAAQFLTDCATMREQGTMGAAGVHMPPVPVVPSPDFIPPPPPADVPTGTDASNVLPFVMAAPIPPPPLPIPPAPTPTANTAADVLPATSNSAATVPAAPAATAAPLSASVSATNSTPTTTANASTLATGPQSTDEYDSAGMPWDARIHQSGKGKKKDLTWKLKKNIDMAIVSAITQELFVAGRVRTAAPTTPSAPASEVPAAPFLGGVPMPPASVDVPAQSSAGQVPIPPPPADGSVPVPPPPVSLQTAAPVPVPPAPAMGVPDTAQPNVVQMGFRELVQKITKLRGENRLSADQVTALVIQAGAPSLGMLANMSHLVPTVDALIDATLATA